MCVRKSCNPRHPTAVYENSERVCLQELQPSKPLEQASEHPSGNGHFCEELSGRVALGRLVVVEVLDEGFPAHGALVGGEQRGDHQPGRFCFPGFAEIFPGFAEIFPEIAEVIK